MSGNERSPIDVGRLEPPSDGGQIRSRKCHFPLWSLMLAFTLSDDSWCPRYELLFLRVPNNKCNVFY